MTVVHYAFWFLLSKFLMFISFRFEYLLVYVFILINRKTLSEYYNSRFFIANLSHLYQSSYTNTI